MYLGVSGSRGALRAFEMIQRVRAVKSAQREMKRQNLAIMDMPRGNNQRPTKVTLRNDLKGMGGGGWDPTREMGGGDCRD